MQKEFTFNAKEFKKRCDDLDYDYKTNLKILK